MNQYVSCVQKNKNKKFSQSINQSIKFKKKKGVPPVTSTDYLKLALTPLRIRWTTPLSITLGFQGKPYLV
jgi:hypothetical protein